MPHPNTHLLKMASQTKLRSVQRDGTASGKAMNCQDCRSYVWDRTHSGWLSTELIASGDIKDGCNCHVSCRAKWTSVGAMRSGKSNVDVLMERCETIQC